MKPAKKLIALITSVMALTACGRPSSESSVMEAGVPTTPNQVSFYGQVADTLRNAMASYPGATHLANGYRLSGLNTSITCKLDGLCTIDGPSIVAGNLGASLPEYPGNRTGVGFKPLQQQLFEALKGWATFKPAATGLSILQICTVTTTSGTEHCDWSKDYLSLSERTDHFDQNPNKPYYYAAKLNLAPAPADTPAQPAGHVSFNGVVADALRNAMAAYAGSTHLADGYRIKGLNTTVTCLHNGLCTFEGTGVVTGSLEVVLPSYPGYKTGSAQKPIQQLLFEAIDGHETMGYGATGIAGLQLCRLTTTGTSQHCDWSYDNLVVTETTDYFDQNPNKAYYYEVRLELVPAQ